MMSLTSVTRALKLFGLSRPMSNTLCAPGWKKHTHTHTRVLITKGRTCVCLMRTCVWVSTYPSSSFPLHRLWFLLLSFSFFFSMSSSLIHKGRTRCSASPKPFTPLVYVSLSVSLFPLFLSDGLNISCWGRKTRVNILNLVKHVSKVELDKIAFYCIVYQSTLNSMATCSTVYAVVV